MPSEVFSLQQGLKKNTQITFLIQVGNIFQSDPFIWITNFLRFTLIWRLVKQSLLEYKIADSFFLTKHLYQKNTVMVWFLPPTPN